MKIGMTVLCILAICLVVVVAGNSGYKVGYVAGFQEGQIDTATTIVEKLTQAQQESAAKTPEKKSVSDFWELHASDDRFFYHSLYAAPPLLNTFGDEVCYNYVYTEKGVFAFPVGRWDAEEIYQLYLERPASKQRKFGGELKNL